MKKKMIVFILCICLLCTNLQMVDTFAKASDWKISNINLEHTYVSFRIEDVEKKQNVKLVIKDSETGEISIEKTFTINNTVEDIKINFNKGTYLESGNYYVSVKDMDNNESSTYFTVLYEHNFNISCTAYPNGIEFKDITLSKNESYHVSVSINFKEYATDIVGNDSVYLEYPTQPIGTVISIKCYDDYGCESNQTAVVENQYFGYHSFSARTNALYEISPNYSEDERIVAEVEGNLYYSEYGIKDSTSYTEMISYPKVSDSTDSIRVWIESKNGSKSDIQEVRLEECSVSRYDSSVIAFPCKAEGTIDQDNYTGSIPTTIRTIVNNQEYSSSINSDGKFSLNYPRQKDDSEMTFIIEDQHGCQFTYRINIMNTEQTREDGIITLCKKAYAEVYKNIRIAVQINDKIYYSDYAKSDESIVSVSYPQQKPGEKIKVWYENKNTSKSKEFDTTILDREYYFSANVRTSSLIGEIDTEAENVSYNIFVKINGKEYPCTFTNKRKTKFSCKFPQQKIGSSVQIIVRDTDGYEYAEKFAIKNIKPKLKVNTVYSSDTRLTGKTVAKSKITVKIGKKKYKGKAKANGNFSIKIKTYRVGTKGKINVKTPEGYSTTKTIKISKAYGYAQLSSEVFRTSTKAKLKVVGGRKGDKLKFKIGNKTYTKKIKSNKKYQKIPFKISKYEAGSKIKITLTDKFGKNKSTETDKVYYGTDIHVGMSTSQILLTTWGSPTRKNDWGSFEQWVYEYGNSTLYVYIKGGKVTDIQRFNY